MVYADIVLFDNRFWKIVYILHSNYNQHYCNIWNNQFDMLLKQSYYVWPIDVYHSYSYKFSDLSLFFFLASNNYNFTAGINNGEKCSLRWSWIENLINHKLIIFEIFLWNNSDKSVILMSVNSCISNLTASFTNPQLLLLPLLFYHFYIIILWYKWHLVIRKIIMVNIWFQI